MSQLIEIDAERIQEIAGAKRRRTILFITGSDVISRALVDAIEREFSWITVAQVEHVTAACASFAHPLALILVDAGLLKEVEQLSTELSRLHPDAVAAVIEADGHTPRCSPSDILDSKFIQGALPMNLKLDIWLSVIRLMLEGGTYFPPGMLYARTYAPANDAGSALPPAPPPANGRAGADDPSGLTQRELEVLALVSRGMQNKSIAAALTLSEHTVKIHLHNIISKLRAHNRTGAAAWFRDYQARLGEA